MRIILTMKDRFVGSGNNSLPQVLTHMEKEKLHQCNITEVNVV